MSAKDDAIKKLSETIDDVKKKAEPVLEDAKKKVAPAVDEVKKKVGPAVEDAKKRVAPAVDGVKKKVGPAVEDVKKKAAPAVDEVKKRTQPAAASVKKQADKAAKQAKKAGRNLTDKVAEVTAKSEIFVQYGDYEIKTDDMVKRVREAYIAEGHKAADIREVQIYIKPSDQCAYYVINHRDTGRIGF